MCLGPPVGLDEAIGDELMRGDREDPLGMVPSAVAGMSRPSALSYLHMALSNGECFVNGWFFWGDAEINSTEKVEGNE